MSTPWAFLEEFRGERFQGQWPTIPQMFEITCSRFAERKAVTAYEPAALTFTYRQALEQVVRTL